MRVSGSCVCAQARVCGYALQQVDQGMTGNMYMGKGTLAAWFTLTYDSLWGK